MKFTLLFYLCLVLIRTHKWKCKWSTMYALLLTFFFFLECNYSFKLYSSLFHIIISFFCYQLSASIFFHGYIFIFILNRSINIMDENYDEFSMHEMHLATFFVFCSFVFHIFKYLWALFYPHEIKNCIFNLITLFCNYTERKLTSKNNEECMKIMIEWESE